MVRFPRLIDEHEGINNSDVELDLPVRMELSTLPRRVFSAIRIKYNTTLTLTISAYQRMNSIFSTATVAVSLIQDLKTTSTLAVYHDAIEWCNRIVRYARAASRQCMRLTNYTYHHTNLSQTTCPSANPILVFGPTTRRLKQGTKGAVASSAFHPPNTMTTTRFSGCWPTERLDPMKNIHIACWRCRHMALMWKKRGLGKSSLRCRERRRGSSVKLPGKMPR